MTAYYNEIDPYAAEWLRNLIKAGEIAPGIVDERSIEDVAPEEIREFTQCHFFAGIGIWSAALRRAGWSDDRPVWTGSCPCQPFSAAGKGGGFDDERHLWPAWQWLIAELRPRTVFGEQVASKDGLAWFDLVSSDMEGTGYAVAPIDLCAAGVGAPHIRQRLWFAAERLADANGGDTSSQWEQRGGKHGQQPQDGSLIGLAQTNRGECDGRSEAARGNDSDRKDAGRQKSDCRPASGEPNGRMGHASDSGPQGRRSSERPEQRQDGQAAPCRSFDGMEDPSSNRRQTRRGDRVPQSEQAGRPVWMADTSTVGRDEKHAHGRGRGVGNQTQGDASRFVDGSGDYGPSTTNRHWQNADWLHCTDGKWRPVEPGTFPLAHGIASRVGRLRAYGNGICLEAAQEIIASFLDVRP